MAATATDVRRKMRFARTQKRARRQTQRQRNAAKRALIANPRVQFANWLKTEHPQVFDEALQLAQSSAAGQMALLRAAQAGVTEGDQLGQWDLSFLDPVTMPDLSAPVAEKSFWEKFMEGALAGGVTYLTLKNQRDAMKINLDRAQAGLPPIDVATSAPVIKTVVDIEPTLARDLASNIGAGINRNMLIIGAVGLVVLFFMMRK